MLNFGDNFGVASCFGWFWVAFGTLDSSMVPEPFVAWWDCLMFSQQIPERQRSHLGVAATVCLWLPPPRHHHHHRPLQSGWLFYYSIIQYQDFAHSGPESLYKETAAPATPFTTKYNRAHGARDSSTHITQPELHKAMWKLPSKHPDWHIAA